MTATPSSIVEECHAASELPIRADLTAAHAHVWEKLAAPGTWWNGGERLAIAEIVGAEVLIVAHAVIGTVDTAKIWVAAVDGTWHAVVAA